MFIIRRAYFIVVLATINRLTSGLNFGLTRSGPRIRSSLFAIPPKGSKFTQPDDPSYAKGTASFPALPTYVPDLDYPGDMKPGTTPENNPLKDLLKKGIPHRQPYYQELPFNLRWPSSHPPAMDMMDWIEMNGRLLSPEEEREIDLRTKKQAAAVAPIRPKMVSTADIDRQLLESGDEKLFSAALENEGDAVDSESLPVKKKTKAKKPRPVSSVPTNEETSLDSDERLLEEALGGFDFSEMEETK